MNKASKNKFKLPIQERENPFMVPDGYFNSFSEKLKERLKEQESGKADEPESEVIEVNERSPGKVWLHMRPHIALAAAITGFALISFTLIKILIGTGNIDDSYDLSFLDENGILDESVFLETLAESEEYDDDTYTEWEIDAMEYLASNEVYLEELLNEN